MSQTSREIVTRTLKFQYPERIARDLWCLPWAEKHHPKELAELKEKYPTDFGYPPNIYNKSTVEKGDPHAVGTYIDPWGCIFTNIHDGIIGEVKTPLVEDLSDLSPLHIPNEIMPTDRQKAIDTVNRFCDQSDKFVFAACCPRPWEQMQFIRGTMNAMMDVMTPDGGAKKLLAVMQEFYLRQMDFWAKTNVDSLMFMDDWGSQNSLLIPPSIWEELFKPMYKEYCDIAKACGKFIFMHSDGCITEIYPHLVEIGVSAVNSQLFCMDMEKISKIAKGKLTFWGEIDRQHVLPNPDTNKTIEAVNKVAKYLYDPSGGIIAQFEFSPGLYPPNATAVYEQWNKIHRQAVK